MFDRPDLHKAFHSIIFNKPFNKFSRPPVCPTIVDDVVVVVVVAATSRYRPMQRPTDQRRSKVCKLYHQHQHILNYDSLHLIRSLSRCHSLFPLPSTSYTINLSRIKQSWENKRIHHRRTCVEWWRSHLGRQLVADEQVERWRTVQKQRRTDTGSKTSNASANVEQDRPDEEIIYIHRWCIIIKFAGEETTASHRFILSVSLFASHVRCTPPPPPRSHRLHAQRRRKKHERSQQQPSANETFANRASSSTRILCYAKQLNWTTTKRRISRWCPLLPNIPRWFRFNWFIWESQRNKWSKCGKTTTLFCTRALKWRFIFVFFSPFFLVFSKWLQVFKTNQ